MDAKPIYKSKTFWLSALTPLVLALEPAAHEFAARNPTWFGAALSGVFLLLRLFTGQPVSLNGKSFSSSQASNDQQQLSFPDPD